MSFLGFIERLLISQGQRKNVVIIKTEMVLLWNTFALHAVNSKQKTKLNSHEYIYSVIFCNTGILFYPHDIFIK